MIKKGVSKGAGANVKKTSKSAVEKSGKNHSEKYRGKKQRTL